MAFRDFPGQLGIGLLQRSLERGRLAHAYLFTGGAIADLEDIARTLAKTLNCLEPVRGAGGVPIDCCDHCVNCRKVEHGNHADVHWVRPESKSRVIVIEQIRDLMQSINLKPTEAAHKVSVMVGADRLNVHAANAFLKTLEEPPPGSILMLLTTDAERLLETILSRCLRLNFGGESIGKVDPAQLEWLRQFTQTAATEQKSLIGRYRLLDLLLQQLGKTREALETTLTERSPLNRYEDAEKALRDKWEDELAAAIESEYRRHRSELLKLVQWWLRDVWLETLALKNNGAVGGQKQPAEALLGFPDLAASRAIASRVSPEEAVGNLDEIEALQRLLSTNVQEALALEVSLLKLHL